MQTLRNNTLVIFKAGTLITVDDSSDELNGREVVLAHDVRVCLASKPEVRTIIPGTISETVRLRIALMKCLHVLGGEGLQKSALEDALRAGLAALKATE